MNMSKLCIVNLCCFLFLSCSSVPAINKYSKTNDIPVNYRIIVKNVSVEDNYVKTRDIENQIVQNIQTLYMKSHQTLQKKIKKKKIDNKDIYLDVVITQKSFVKNIDNFNSIFMSAKLTDLDGNVIFQTCYNKETKNTIVSCYEQNKLCKLIFRETNKFVLKNVKK